jgi:acetyl-CoA synthetase
MPTETVVKARGPVAPNLADYETARAGFSWAEARRALDGLPGGRGLNIAYEAVDRHAAGLHGQRVALRCLGRGGEVRELTYARLRAETNRFANVLRALGVGKGERVFLLLGRTPDLYVAALGTLKNTSVLSPLFPAFGPEPIRQRLALGDARVLVTTATLYRRKVAGIRASLPNLAHVLIAEGETPEGTLDLHDLLSVASDDFEIPLTDPEDMALVHFTSGTTGTPKGAVHVHDAVVAHHATGAGGGRRDRHARSGDGRSGEGVRVPASRLRTQRRAAPRTHRLRPRPPRRRRRPPGDHLRPAPPQEQGGQDHAQVA